jgi:heme oxygenase
VGGPSVRTNNDLPRRGHAHARLRTATRGLHDSLDRQIVPSTLADRASYVRFLSMNWACASIEPALAEAGVHRLLPDWNQRQRRFALADDLEALGARPARFRLEAIDVDAGTIFGWCYVLEGSRLGARLILRTVEASDDPEVRGTTRFLSHGAGTNFWASFTRALSQIDHDEAAIAKACAAARTAFQCFVPAVST